MRSTMLLRPLAISLLLTVTVVFAAGCTPRMMGVNHAGEKLERERTWNAKLGYYLLSRFLDTLDMVTLNAGLGPALHGEVHITNAARLGVGGAYLASFGTGAAPRDFGFFGRGIAELSLLPWSAQINHWDEYLSTGEDFDVTTVDFRSPTEQVFRRKADYWSVGASAGFLIVGGQIELHPLQMADWLLGWFTIDFLNDDL